MKISSIIFYVILAISSLVFSFSYAFGQYIALKDHNLNVVKGVISCVEKFDDKASDACSKKIKEQYVFYGISSSKNE